jgi:hypothetical protein
VNCGSSRSGAAGSRGKLPTGPHSAHFERQDAIQHVDIKRFFMAASLSNDDFSEASTARQFDRLAIGDSPGDH